MPTIQPPVSADDAREAQRIAGEHSLICVDDADIAEMARAIARRD